MLVWLAGLQCIAGIIMALGHCLEVHLHWLGRVLYSQFQTLRGSVCCATRILRQGTNSEEDTVLTCIGVHYAIPCQTLERCLKILQNSIACFQEIQLSFVWFSVSVLLCSASGWSRADKDTVGKRLIVTGRLTRKVSLSSRWGWSAQLSIVLRSILLAREYWITE
jgi:hypothetical protein